MGDTHQQLGQYESAINKYNEALSICKETRDGEIEGLLLFKIGRISHGNLKHFQKSAENMKKALKIAE